jgi:hypothetical protein
MANKRYDQFAAGTPVGTDIILFADPNDGELKKVAIEDLPAAAAGCLFSDSTLVNANNSGADPETIATVTIPASVFDTIGRFVEVIALGEGLNTTGPPNVRLLVSGTDAAPMVLSVTGQFRIEAWIQRISTTQLKYYQFNTRVLTNAGASGITTVGLNQGNDLVITLRITGAAANRVYVLGLNAKVFEV